MENINTKRFSEELAENMVEEQITLKPELYSIKSSLIKQKIADIENQVLNFEADVEKQTIHAVEILRAWFKNLPQEQQAIFQKELDHIQAVCNDPNFENLLTDLLFNEENETNENIFGISDNFLNSIFQEALRIQKENRHEDTITLCMFISFFNKKFYAHLFAAGYSHLQLGHIEEAQNLFDATLVLAPNEPKFFYFSSLCNLMGNRKENAQVFCEAGLHIAQNNNDLVWLENFKKLNELIVNS